MKLTKHQEASILLLDISGKGGKDTEIATALGFERKSARFYDAIDSTGEKWEFKKQQDTQWIDPYKLSELSKEQKKIKILFFMHKKGKVTEIYETDYKKLIKSMGYSARDLKAIKKMYDRQSLSSRRTQIKAELKGSEIKVFKKVWQKNP